MTVVVDIEAEPGQSQVRLLDKNGEEFAQAWGPTTVGVPTLLETMVPYMVALVGDEPFATMLSELRTRQLARRPGEAKAA